MLSEGISMSGLHSFNITYYDHFILALLFQPALLFCFPASAISWIPESPSAVLHLVIFSTENKLKWLGKDIQGHLWTCHSLSRVKNLFLLYVNFMNLYHLQKTCHWLPVHSHVFHLLLSDFFMLHFRSCGSLTYEYIRNSFITWVKPRGAASAISMQMNCCLLCFVRQYMFMYSA